MAQKKFSILTELTLNAAGFDKGADGAKKKFSALAQGSEQAASSIKGAFSNVAGMFTPMLGQLDGLTDSVGGGVKAFKAMIPAIKGVKAAFIATGIGAIVVALGAAFAGLVAWIKRTDEGGDSMRKVFDVIKAVINTILDKLAALGSAIVKLFKGDFKGAGEDAKRAFTGWGDAISENVKKAKELNEIQDKLEDYNETAALRKKKIELEISELSEKSRDTENYSAQERLDFITRLKAAYKELHGITKEGFNLELAELRKEESTNANNQEIRQKINEKVVEGLGLEAELNKNIEGTHRLYNKTRGEIAKAVEEQKKLIAASKAEDKVGLKKIDSVKIEAPKSNLVSDLTARQNAYNESLQKTNSLWQDFGKQITNSQVLMQTFSTAIDGITGAFTDMFTSGAGAFKNFVTSMLQGIQKIINGLLAQAIAGMIAGEAKKGIVGLALGAIGIAALTGLWQAKVPKFAMGAVVNTPTYAMIGEAGPEVVMNRMQLGAMANSMRGGMGGKVEFVIRDRQLVGILENYSKIQSRGR